MKLLRRQFLASNGWKDEIFSISTRREALSPESGGSGAESSTQPLVAGTQPT